MTKKARLYLEGDLTVSFKPVVLSYNRREYHLIFETTEERQKRFEYAKNAYTKMITNRICQMCGCDIGRALILKIDDFVEKLSVELRETGNVGYENEYGFKCEIYLNALVDYDKLPPHIQEYINWRMTNNRSNEFMTAILDWVKYNIQSCVKDLRYNNETLINIDFKSPFNCDITIEE